MRGVRTWSSVVSITARHVVGQGEIRKSLFQEVLHIKFEFVCHVKHQLLQLKFYLEAAHFSFNEWSGN
jgi:hypothetical protein